ncbi:MAG TPA: hypothetical protein VLJ59_20985 [Mycobacteriales bacterium]|nr:hypothetical protein [Mycobacteriales bacterium]
MAGRELVGVRVAGLDASVVLAASGRENAKATYKGGDGFVPNLASPRQPRRRARDRPEAGQRHQQRRRRVTLPA